MNEQQKQTLIEIFNKAVAEFPDADQPLMTNDKSEDGLSVTFREVMEMRCKPDNSYFKITDAVMAAGMTFDTVVTLAKENIEILKSLTVPKSKPAR